MAQGQTNEVEARVTGSNLPPIAELGEQMIEQAALWNVNVAKGDTHKNEILIRAYQLRLYAEDANLRLFVEGMLTTANIPNSKRSSLFTRLVNYAFHKSGDEWKVNRVRVHRWAGTLEYVWSHCKPRPTAETLLETIRSKGGEAGCNDLLTRAGPPRVKTTPKSIPIPCDVDLHLPEGETAVSGKMERTANGWQFTIRIPEVVSGETTATEQAP